MILELIRGIFGVYEISDHTGIVKVVQDVCTDMQQFSFLNVDTSLIYEQYY